MPHKCPHCQKGIMIKMLMELKTEEQFLDEHVERNNKEKEDDPQNQ